MRRLTITLNVEFGREDPEQPQPTDRDAMVERSHPEPDERAEMDGRRAGFRGMAARD